MSSRFTTNGLVYIRRRAHHLTCSSAFRIRSTWSWATSCYHLVVVYADGWKLSLRSVGNVDGKDEKAPVFRSLLCSNCKQHLEFGPCWREYELHSDGIPDRMGDMQTYSDTAVFLPGVNDVWGLPVKARDHQSQGKVMTSTLHAYR